MFSDQKDSERRGTERQRDGSRSFIRHRIPYRLLGRRSLSAKRLVVSSKVFLKAIPTQNCDVVLTFPANTADSTLMWLLARLKTRAPALTVNVRHHSHTGIYGFYLTALYENLLQGAEELGILKPLKTEYGGGMKEFVCEDQDCFAGVEDENSFLTSQERQSIVLHFLHELRATGDDSLDKITFIEGQPIVPLLITKKVVSQVFPLHNNEDLKVLRQTWVQAIFSRQPLDSVCRYFGVKIGLYFAYLGHYTTWLILPALVGLIIFLLQGSNQRFDDLCFVGFALFNVVWATLYIKFWKRSSTEYCYKWGTLEKKDELLKDPRPLFKGDLAKSPVTGHLEMVYPAWKRHLFSYFITFPTIAVCLAVVFFTMLLCFEIQEWVNELILEEELPYVFSFVPKVLLAVVVSILDEIYKQIAIWLTCKENYRLEESHETSLVIKLVLFQFVNSFLSLFYIGFYLRDMDRLRDQLGALLITRQVLGNLKEALMPYIIWKARLYSVGYKIATRMSPASVEKEVRKMTTKPGRDGSSAAEKSSKTNLKERKEGGSGKNSDSENSTVTEEDDEGVPALTQAEVESAMKKYEDTLDDYLEMCIQFGYITLFSSAFPLAAMCALLNNVIEVRSDAFKLCLTHQRPFGQRVENIGIWQDVLLVISVIAVIVNCALIGTSGLLARMLPGLSTTAYCSIIVLVEHLILTTKFALYRSIPDLPYAVATEMARLEYRRTEALKQLVSQTAPSQGGSLMSHHLGSPNMRRRRFGEEADRDCSPPRNSTNGRETDPISPTVITPTSSTPRPSDIKLLSNPSRFAGHLPASQKPIAPPRSSKPKPEIASSHPDTSASHNVAEKVVAAVMNPILNNVDSDPLSSSSTSSVSSRSDIHGLTGEEGRPSSSSILRRVYRNRADLEERRRRSEPVSSAVSQAVNLHRESSDAVFRRKSFYDNKEDLRDVMKDPSRRHIREEIKRSRERLNLLDDTVEQQKQCKDSSVTSSDSNPRISTVLTTLPPPVSSSSHSFSRFSASPRLLRGGTLGDPSSLSSKSLSRKSRSFSSADVHEAKQAFKERFSWKGELPSIRRSSSTAKSSQKKNSVDTDKDLKLSPREDGSASTVENQPNVDRGDTEVAVRDVGDDQVILTSLSSSGIESSSSRDVVKTSGEITPSLSTDSVTSSDPKSSISSRAVRESASKPLSFAPKSMDAKEK